MNDHYDLIVVGAGPAGLSTAYTAAKGGLKVLILERNKEVGRPVHTSGGSWVQDMQYFGVPPDCYHVPKRCIFHSKNKRVEQSSDLPIFCILDVTKTYQFLAKKAQAAGAELRLGCNVSEPILSEGKVVGVKYNSNGSLSEVRAKIVVDAGGMNSVLARSLGLQQKVTRYGIGAEYDILAAAYNQEEMHVIANNKYTYPGYAWVLPLGKNKVRVGVALLHPNTKADPGHCLERFISYLPKFIPWLEDYEILEQHGGTIPCGKIEWRFVTNGFMVVGDAGNQISMLIGEGIRYCLYAGEIAGSVACEAVHAKDCSANFLRAFERQLHQRYWFQLKLHYRINLMMSDFNDKDWDRVLEFLELLPLNEICTVFHGEIGPTLLWKLVRRRPRGCLRMLPRFLRVLNR